MQTIWLLEDVGTAEQSIASILTSNYPLRTIRSVDSYAKLMAIEPSSRHPEFVIVNVGAPLRYEDAVHFVKASKGSRNSIEIVFLSGSHESWKEILVANFRTNFIEFENESQLVSDLRDVIERGTVILNSAGINDAQADKLNSVLRFGDLSYDRLSRVLTIGGSQSSELPTKECRILEVLLLEANKEVSRPELSSAIWNNISVTERTLDTHISRLRRKLNESSNCTIVSVYGRGYSLRCDDDLAL